MSWKDDLNKVSETLQQYRDELKVRMHLAREDIKDEWEDLDAYWDRFRQKLEEIRNNSDEASTETRETAHKLGEDLKEGYERIRQKLK